MPDLRFFGSTVDAIAPQEQNVLSQFRQHNWNVEAANAAAAERARALSMEAFARAQQQEQQQAQQDYANRVNLLQFANRNAREAEGEQRRQFEWNTGRTDRASELAADNALRLTQFGQRTAESDQKNFATLQSLITGRKVRTIDEAWAYVPKTPENVERISKQLQTVNDEIVKEQVDDLNAATVKRKADKLAQALKLNPQLDSQNKRRALNLDPIEVELIPKMFGQVDPRIRWDSGKDEWTIAPVPATSRSSTPAAAYSQNVTGVDLSQFAPLREPSRPTAMPVYDPSRFGLPPSVSEPMDTRPAMRPGSLVSAMFANQRPPEFYGGNPRVDLSQFRTATNAPVATPSLNVSQRPAIWNPDGSVSTVSSIGVGDERGEWVIPTIIGGRRVSNQEATQLWRVGKNPPLGGPFRSVDESNRFAQQFHEQEASRIGVPATPPIRVAPGFVAPTVNMTPTPLPAAAPFGRTGGAAMMDFSNRPIGTQAEYSALPSGARFVWVYADGRRRAGVKP